MHAGVGLCLEGQGGRTKTQEGQARECVVLGGNGETQASTSGVTALGFGVPRGEPGRGVGGWEQGEGAHNGASLRLSAGSGSPQNRMDTATESRGLWRGWALGAQCRLSSPVFRRPHLSCLLSCGGCGPSRAGFVTPVSLLEPGVCVEGGTPSPSPSPHEARGGVQLLMQAPRCSGHAGLSVKESL